MFIYNYIREGDIPEHLRVRSSNQQNLKIYEPVEEYQKNVIMLIESFFLYQFKPNTDRQPEKKNPQFAFQNNAKANTT